MAEEVKAVTPTPSATPSVEEAVAQAVAKVNADWDAKFQGEVNKTSKALRETYDKKLKESTLTETERIANEQAEQYKVLQEELAQLRGEKSSNLRKNAIAEAKLPNHFTNDIRVINAKDDELPNVIKTLSKEWSQVAQELTKGQVVGTAPKVSTEKTQSPISDELLKRYPHLAKIKR